MIQTERLFSTINQNDTPEEKVDISLRPKLFADYIGQDKLLEQIQIFVQAAKNRNEALDHVLLFGPPGLGKTTLASVIANELGVNVKHTSGPVIEKAGDLAAILTNLDKNDVLFIDEIHRLNSNIEEILYPAMEDKQIDIILGEGPNARTIKIDLQPFTLIGATTRAGMLTSPLRDRFGIIQRLEFYNDKDLTEIVKRSANLLNIKIDNDGAYQIASRSRGTPRIANRLLKRIRDFVEVKGFDEINANLADDALSMLEINKSGLDSLDLNILKTILHNFDGGPVGLDNIAASVGESKDTIEDVIEPYLLQKGFIIRTPRGRKLTDLGIQATN